MPFLSSSMDTPNGCTYAGISHRYPRCARRSKSGQAMPIGRRLDRMTWSSTSKDLSKSIGAPPSASSGYPVRCHHRLVRPFLTEERRNHCHWKTPWVPRFAILCTPHCPYHRNCTSQPAIDIRIAGIPPRVASKPRGFISWIFHPDNRIDGTFWGRGY